MLYPWVVFLHVLSVFGFLLAHGSAAAVAFKLRDEREVAPVRALLALSRRASGVGNAFLLLLVVTGVAAGFMGSWWGHSWIWTSLALLVLLGAAMSILSARTFMPIRRLIGEDGPRRKPQTTSTSSAAPVDTGALATAIAGTRPWLYVASGGGVLIIILWLMMFKPF